MTSEVANTVILQCRTGSSRLPGKALLPLGGLPVAVLAARRAAGPGKRVVLATSDRFSDDALAQEAAAHGIEVFRGSLEDVLGRFVAVLEGTPDEAFVTRLTGDNPVPDGQLIDEVVAEMAARGAEYMTTTHPEAGLPYGVSIEVTRVGHLRQAAREARSAAEREHVTPHVIAHFGRTFFRGRAALNCGAYRMTIDSLDDYLSLRRVFDGLDDPETVPWHVLVARAGLGCHQPAGAGLVDRFVMGTVQLGLNYGISRARTEAPDEYREMIKTAIGNGCAWLDTAQAYGESERIVGDTLATGWAGRCRVVTKLDPLANLGAGSSRAEWGLAAELSVMRSCVALRMQRLDTLLLHRAAHLTAGGGAVWDRLQSLRDAGRIDRLGVSVQSPDELALALDTPGVAHVQMPCNLLDYRWTALFPRIAQRRDEAGLVVHVRSVFLQGLLIGGTAGDWGRAGVADPAPVQDWLARMAATCGRQSVADLCLAWAQAQPWIDGIILGSDNLAQIAQNLSLFRAPPLSPADLKRLQDSRPTLPAASLDPARWAPRDATAGAG